MKYDKYFFIQLLCGISIVGYSKPMITITHHNVHESHWNTENRPSMDEELVNMFGVSLDEVDVAQQKETSQEGKVKSDQSDLIPSEIFCFIRRGLRIPASRLKSLHSNAEMQAREYNHWCDRCLSSKNRHQREEIIHALAHARNWSQIRIITRKYQVYKR